MVFSLQNLTQEHKTIMKVYGWKAIDERNHVILTLDLETPANTSADKLFDSRGELETFHSYHPGSGRWFRSYSSAKRVLLKHVRYNALFWRNVANQTLRSRKHDSPDAEISSFQK